MTPKQLLSVFRARYRAAILAVTALCAAAVAQVDWKSHLDKVDFLTEYYFLQDMHSYFGQKNDWQDSAYLLSGYSELEAMLVSYEDVFHIGAMYANYLGMGKQSAAILFDPREANYTIVPFLEFRYKNIFYQLGLDHRCYHLVDRNPRVTLPEKMSPYWNMPYLKVSSANFRTQQFKKDYLARDRFGLLDRFRWQASAGYFIWEWGDMNKSLLGGGHEWGTMASVDLEYSFYKTKSWLFTAAHKLTVYGDTTGTGYWAGLVGIDADIYNRKNTLGFFVNHNYEFPRELPRYSRDQLWAWGFRFRV